MGVLGVKFLQPLVVLCWLLRGRRVVSSDKGFALYISKESYLCKIVAVCLEFFSRYHTYHLSLWTREHFTDWAVLLLLSSQLYRWRCQGWCGYPSPKACSEFTPWQFQSPAPWFSLRCPHVLALRSSVLILESAMNYFVQQCFWFQGFVLFK